MPPQPRKTEAAKVQKPPKVQTWAEKIRFSHEPKHFRRPRKKNLPHPLQQVRVIAKLSQEDFAASLAIKLDTYKHIIEGRQTIPDEVKAKVFDRYGAIVIDHKIPARAFGPQGVESYTENTFKAHKDMSKAVWEPFRIEETTRGFCILADAVREKAQERNDVGLLRLLRMEYTLMLKHFVEQFGVFEEVRNRILTLRRSRDASDIRLCYLLCKITDSNFLLPTLHRNPEHERLERVGMVAAAKEGKIGEWFKGYVYPPE